VHYTHRCDYAHSPFGVCACGVSVDRLALDSPDLFRSEPNWTSPRGVQLSLWLHPPAQPLLISPAPLPLTSGRGCSLVEAEPALEREQVPLGDQVCLCTLPPLAPPLGVVVLAAPLPRAPQSWPSGPAAARWRSSRARSGARSLSTTCGGSKRPSGSTVPSWWHRAASHRPCSSWWMWSSSRP